MTKFHSNIIEINDFYEHIDPNIEYVLENVLYEEDGNCDERDYEFIKLKELYNSKLLNLCTCTTNCTENDSCSHGHRYKMYYNSDLESEELILDYISDNDLIYECSDLCKCIPSKCFNRLVQYGPRKHLEIQISNKFKSLGVFTTSKIPKGGFVCEYAGELLTPKEAQKRFFKNEKSKSMNYIIYLYEINKHNNANGQIPSITVVDPSNKGNIGRYINHSCAPNCNIYSVRIDCPVPKLAIFTNQKISPGEELTFHYSGGTQKKRSSTNPEKLSCISCLCKSPNCEKYLPKIIINEDGYSQEEC